MYRPRYPALVLGPGALGRRFRRLRRGGDLRPGGRRRRADRGRLRAAAGGRLHRGRASRRARRWCSTIAPTTSASSICDGDKAATDAAFARAAHVVRQHFVINRVTAATMEPRGSIGDYNAADGRYTVYTTLQRTHPFRAELAQACSRCRRTRSASSPATSAAASA